MATTRDREMSQRRDLTSRGWRGFAQPVGLPGFRVFKCQQIRRASLVWSTPMSRVLASHSVVGVWLRVPPDTSPRR